MVAVAVEVVNAAVAVAAAVVVVAVAAAAAVVVVAAVVAVVVAGGVAHPSITRVMNEVPVLETVRVAGVERHQLQLWKERAWLGRATECGGGMELAVAAAAAGRTEKAVIDSAAVVADVDVVDVVAVAVDDVVVAVDDVVVADSGDAEHSANNNPWQTHELLQMLPLTPTMMMMMKMTATLEIPQQRLWTVKGCSCLATATACAHAGQTKAPRAIWPTPMAAAARTVTTMRCHHHRRCWRWWC